MAETPIGGNLFFEQKVFTPVGTVFLRQRPEREMVCRETRTAVLPPLPGIRKVLSPLEGGNYDRQNAC
jgi:hypothetical protein